MKDQLSDVEGEQSMIGGEVTKQLSESESSSDESDSEER